MHRMLIGAGLATVLLAFHVNAGKQDPATERDPIFAKINDLTISTSEFQAIFKAAVRQKYYHGRVPAAELEEFRQQVVDDIVTQVLVHDKALQHGLRPDRKKIDEDIDAFILNNAANPELQAQRETVVPRLVATLERRDLLEQMEAKIKDLPAPEDAQVEQYYLDHPGKFTEPRRLRLSAILLKVPPFASEGTWIEAETVAGELKQRIEAGVDFAVLAKEYSAHPSAVNGGDLGYLHQGVLEPEVQEKLEVLDLGELSAPMRVLEGIMLFRMDGVQSPELKSFDDVKNRAAGLLYREIQDSTWATYVDELRSTANVYVNE